MTDSGLGLAPRCQSCPRTMESHASVVGPAYKACRICIRGDIPPRRTHLRGNLYAPAESYGSPIRQKYCHSISRHGGFDSRPGLMGTVFLKSRMLAATCQISGVDVGLEL